MKRLLPILLLIVLSCGEEPEGRQAATICRLVRIETPIQKEVSTRDEIAYTNGKLNHSLYYTKQPGKDWDYVERKEYAYTKEGMDIQIIRPDFTINGSFVLDSQGNLIEYSDDYFAHVYLYAYDGNTLLSDGRYSYIVNNSNIVERIEIKTGQTIDRFTYDDRPNPLHGLFYEPIGNDIMEYFRFYNKNNVLTETHVSEGGIVVRYDYEYGEQGFPVKQTWRGTNRVIEYTYLCE